MFHTARVRCYNVTMNEVVYARVNDVVMAMKITEYKLIRNVFGHINHYAVFQCADGNVIEKLTYSTDNKFKLYRTIEDCINQNNEIELVWFELNKTLTRLFNFDSERTCVGYIEFGKTMYYWDGFNVKSVHIPYQSFDMYISEFEIRLEKNKSFNDYYDKYKLYETEEECRADNYVKVMTF